MSANPHSVRKISDDTLVKASWNFGAQHLEASTIEFVRTHTTIPIPRVRGRFEDEEGLLSAFIVRDDVGGDSGGSRVHAERREWGDSGGRRVHSDRRQHR
jgi:hypothetical protein